MAGPKDRLRVISVMEGKTTKGLAPLFLTTWKWGPIGFKVVAPIGWTAGEYVDLLIPDPKCAGVVLKRLIKYKDWDILSLNRLPSSSPMLPNIIKAAKDRGLSTLVEGEQVCPFLKLEGTFEDFMGVRFRSKFRNRIRRMTGKLSALGDHRFEIVRDAAGIDGVFNKIAELEKISWKGAQGKGLFGQMKIRSFLRQIIMVLAETGKAAIHLQWLDARLLSYHFGFIAQDQYYDYNLAFDPEFARYSPGFLSLADLVRQCYEMGL